MKVTFVYTDGSEEKKEFFSLAEARRAAYAEGDHLIEWFLEDDVPINCRDCGEELRSEDYCDACGSEI